MDRRESARSALVLVHMAKGVVGDVDTPFNRMFRQRAEETGIIKVQARLLDGFRTAKVKVVYTLVTYQPGFPGVSANSPLFRTAIDANTLREGTPAVEIIDELAPGPTNRSSGDRRATGLTAPSWTPFSAWQVSTPSCSSAWPPTSPSNPPRAVHATWLPDDRRLRRLHGRQRRRPHPPARRAQEVVRRDTHRRGGPQRPAIATSAVDVDDVG